ncbi:YihY/virulence factor BrkB family protein [Planctomycetota bacterium]
MLSKVINFLKTDIWRIHLKNYPRRKSFFLRQLRIVVLAIRGFAEDKCKFRASALTFYSLLSVVPVIAMMFGIAKGFGLEKRVETELLQRMQGQDEIAKRIIDFANSLLENASGGFIAGVGVAFLFWAIIKVLTNIENSFNDIWGVKIPRTLGRKFSDYLSMMLVCPFLLIMAGSATVVISTQVRVIIQQFSVFSAIGPLILFLLKLLPYCTIWIMFTFVFIFMPNTKVKLRSGLLAGVVAGTIFQIAQWIYISFQIGAAKYSAIYGSFAALPLFLLWLQISWLVVLFGAELSFAHQNVETYEFEQDCLSASYSFKKLLSLLVTHLLIKNFCKAEQPWDAEKISHTLEIPIRLVRQILFELVGSGILSEVRKDDDKDVAYQPAIDVGKITVKYVVESLEQRGNSDVPVSKTNEMKKLSDCLSTFAGDIEKSPANILLKDL